LLDIISGAASGTVLEKRGVAPGFLSSEEIAFERDLARTVSGGFFHKMPFDWQMPGEPPRPLPMVVADAAPRALEMIRAMRADYLQRCEGLDPLQTQAKLATEDRYGKLANLREAAYTGWLVMNTPFREERRVFRLRFGNLVDQLRGFPAVPGSGLESVTPSIQPPFANEEFMNFYGRWGLATFQTWDLPLPLSAAMFYRNAYDPSVSGAAGVNVFIPWYMFRDGQLDLMKLAKDLQKSRNMSHLAGWMETPTARRDRWGDVRLRTALALYRYQNLALQSRYPGRGGWQASRQDTAFAKFLDLSVESVRQVRLHLRQNLPPQQVSELPE
jgi:hypothetical protein